MAVEPRRPGNPVPIGSPLTGPETAIDSIAFSPDGRYLPLALPMALSGSGGMINTVSFGPSGRTMATSDTKGTVWLWDLAVPRRSGRMLAAGTGSIDSALRPDGRTLAATASLGAAGSEVLLWDVADPARPIRLGPLMFPHAATEVVAFSPDGKTLAVGGAADQDGKLAGQVWLFNVANPAHPVRYNPPLKAPASSVVSVAFSPDSRLLAASSGTGVGLWSLADGTARVSGQ
jgi:WD40 repeat protein